MQAYENIFADDFYTNFITGGAFDSVLAGAWQFSTGVGFLGEQLIASDADADADAFSSLFNGVTQFGNLTNTGQALLDANEWFASNGEDGTSLVVDISTDGEPTMGGTGGVSNDQFAFNAADDVRAAGGGRQCDWRWRS